MGIYVNSGLCGDKFCKQSYREFITLLETKANWVRCESSEESTSYNIGDIEKLTESFPMSEILLMQLKACILDGYMCVE